MRRSLLRARDFVRLIGSGHAGEALRSLRVRARSQSLSYGLRRDLNVPFAAPPAKIDLDVRPLTPHDDLSFLEPEPGLPSEVASARLGQRRLVEARVPTCWVAIARNGKPAYMQWLIGSQDNQRIRAQWDNLFPVLGPDEALLEGAYTPEAYRGQGIMPYAMARIAEEAKHLGARYVITFVADHNVPSLKGCKKAGFSPYVERRLSWWFFRRSVTYTPLPAGTPYNFELEAR